MRNIYYTILLLLSCETNSFSQATEIFSLVNRNQLSLTPNQDTFLASVDFDTSYLGYESLEILPNSIEHLSDVYFNITELGGYREFYVEQVFYRDSFVIWVGKSYDFYKYGTLILVQKDDLFSGFISQDNQVWELFPNGNNLALAIKRDKNHDFLATCALDNALPADDDDVPDPCHKPADKCAALIRVMLGMTPEANSWLGIMSDNLSPLGVQIIQWLYALRLEAQVNTAFRNSGVYNKSIQIGHIEDIEFEHNISWFWNLQEFRAVIDDDMNDLVLNSKFIDALTDNYCDLGLLLTNIDYPYYAGLANAIGPDDAFAGIVEIKDAMGHSYAFAHEVGHILGGRHERAFDEIWNICNHAWSIESPIAGSLDYTIINAGIGLTKQDNIILNYSTPFIKVNGQRTGTGIDYNAAAIDNNGCYISEYQPDPYWSVVIIGSDSICDTEPVNIVYSADVHEPLDGFTGVSPYTYIWQWGYKWNDTNFPNLNWHIQTDEGSTLTIPYDPDENNKELFIRLIVVSNDNYIKIEVKQVKLFPPDLFEHGCEQGPYDIEWLPRRGVEIIDKCGFVFDGKFLDDQFAFDLYNLNESMENEYLIEIFDIVGKRILVNKIDLTKSTSFSIPINGLIPNIYIIKASTHCTSKAIKLFKL